MSIKSITFGIAAAVMVFAMTPATAHASVANFDGSTTIGSVGTSQDAESSQRCRCRRYYVARYYYCSCGRWYVRYYWVR